ncbi:alpha/beta hydrolase fold [Chitinasiproducens palmae]|uniref:Alpha/beta hydrolase fold n=2 Tax=Chitinasiproducens palmae TaxID=1770053 RepID=A0A1H2PVZ3_9BURK|nr:alpha/beta hydrolase fold [Chitinasiproducens palmae]
MSGRAGWLRLAAALAIAPITGGCAWTLNATAGHARTVRDVSYGGAPRQRLDVYLPAQTSGETGPGANASEPAAHAAPGRPIVVFLYGGTWQHGDKANYRFVATAFARHGYVAMVPDYRLYPEVRYPTFLQDAAQAVRFARDHAADYGGDPTRLVLVGHSAGAYIAAMLALDSRWLAAEGLRPERALRAVVGIAGPYDFLPLTDPVLQEIFATPQGLPSTQPITHVGEATPPMLLLAGAADHTVDPGNTERLAARIHEHGGPVQAAVYPGNVSHLSIIGAFAPPLRFLAPSQRDTFSFIDAQTGWAESASAGSAANVTAATRAADARP